MPHAISVRLPEKMVERLQAVAETTDRSKSYLIKKAIERYLDEYADQRIALDRLNDPRDEIITSEELKARLAR